MSGEEEPREFHVFEASGIACGDQTRGKACKGEYCKVCCGCCNCRCEYYNENHGSFRDIVKKIRRQNACAG